MRPRSDALYLIWFCWGLALLLYVAGSAYYKLPIVPLLLMVLLLMVEKTKMFGRKRNESEVVGVGSTTTVIAKGARFKGELQVEGNLDVYGQFVGTLLENGKMKGLFKGGSLSIRKGGQFVGQSQSQEEQKGESKGNVKQLQPEGKNKAVDAAEVVAKQA